MALVEAQDKVNKAYPPIPANLATIGETASTTMRGKRVGTRFRPSFTPITDTGQVRMIACLKCKHPGDEAGALRKQVDKRRSQLRMSLQQPKE